MNGDTVNNRPTLMCDRHPTVAATVKVPRGDNVERLLCGDCVREQRPVIFVSLVSVNLPPVPSIR